MNMGSSVTGKALPAISLLVNPDIAVFGSMGEDR